MAQIKAEYLDGQFKGGLKRHLVNLSLPLSGEGQCPHYEDALLVIHSLRGASYCMVGTRIALKFNQLGVG